ncbi:unnamed protein product [Albugo candida]|uniref:Uncharacterized protein n=1 Tax=Albugo candida TaxID=65357 RepID=A0A024G3Z2_9STRA|nr:unnamed protein product [Albugo candida]|eukprot:CCI41282.1 unnamed protein product [Albugo candida]
MADADYQIQEELAAWSSEVKNFLTVNVLHTITHAKEELERLDFLWGKIRIEKCITNANFKTEIRMEGHLIVAADVELKFTKLGRNTTLNTKLQQYCVLHQILEFHRIIESQLSQIRELEAWLFSFGVADTPAEEVADDTLSHGTKELAQRVDRLYEIIREMCRHLRNAGDVLRLPTRRRFPYNNHSDLRFQPALPSDVVIEMSLHRGELLIEAFQISETKKPQQNFLDGCISKSEVLGSVCLLRGQNMEIVDYASTTVMIPQLEEMLGCLDEEIKWLSHAQANAQALLDCVR